MPAGFPASALPSQETRRSRPEIHSDLDRLVPLKTLINHLPATLWGEHPHLSSAIRWITRGVKARNGQRIRLRALKTPGGWLSCSDWLLEFFEQQTLDRMETAYDPSASVPTPVTPARRRREIAHTDRLLDAAGI
jgi:hypothetical protein